MLLKQVEDPAAIAHVRSVVPFEALRHEAQATADLDAQLAEQQQPGSTIGIDDLLVQELLRFFKHDFFSWVSVAAQHIGVVLLHVFANGSKVQLMVGFTLFDAAAA